MLCCFILLVSLSVLYQSLNNYHVYIHVSHVHVLVQCTVHVHVHVGDCNSAS